MGYFYENGEGKYEMTNDIENRLGEEFSVVGNGKSQKNGGGLFGIIDFANKIYIDVSGRYRQVSNEFTSLALKNIDKVEYEYVQST
jgi:hypothetical protein